MKGRGMAKRWLTIGLPIGSGLLLATGTALAFPVGLLQGAPIISEPGAMLISGLGLIGFGAILRRALTKGE